MSLAEPVDARSAVFPGADWAVEPPEAHGLSSEKLAAAAAMVQRIETRAGFLVVKDGVIVHETYWTGDAATRIRIFSVTKGLGASLVGLAETRGLLSVKDRVDHWLPIHHPDIKAGATIEHILSMTAGGEPGKDRYRYTSGPILNSLPNILELATGQTPARFYEEALAAPLGLSIHWPRTERGWMQIGNQGPLPPPEGTHRDLARLGLLWLRRGVWNGQRILSEAFVDAALEPHFPLANANYGYLWWLNRDGAEWTPKGEAPRPANRKRLPDAPDNLFQAIGARGKLIMVVPDHDLVVVTLGETNDEVQPSRDLWAAVKSFLPG